MQKSDKSYIFIYFIYSGSIAFCLLINIFFQFQTFFGLGLIILGHKSFVIIRVWSWRCVNKYRVDRFSFLLYFALSFLVTVMEKVMENGKDEKNIYFP